MVGRSVRCSEVLSRCEFLHNYRYLTRGESPVCPRLSEETEKTVHIVDLMALAIAVDKSRLHLLTHIRIQAIAWNPHKYWRKPDRDTFLWHLECSRHW